MPGGFMEGRKTMKGVAAFFGIAVLLLAFGAPKAAAVGGQYVSISGCSVSNLGYLRYLTAQYEELTGAKILLMGGGSRIGLADLAGRRVDVDASCMSKTAGTMRGLRFTQVAWDALVFIVNKSNPVKNITLKQVRDIYFGKVTNWRQLGGPDMPLESFISNPSEMGGVDQSLSRLVLGGRMPPVVANSRIVGCSAAMWEQMVEVTPGGFAATGFASARFRNLRMLEVDGAAPTKRNIISGRYPLKRPLWLVTGRAPGPAAQKFIRFVLSAEGQGLISKYGVPSLRDIK